MDASNDDRRQAPRVELRSVGTIDLGDQERPCQLLDVSNTGMALVAPGVPPHRAVRVRFRLGSHDAAWTEIDAIVVRSSEWDERNMVWGMEFQPMDLGTRTRLRGFVARGLRN